MRGSRIPYSISQMSGRLPFLVLELHKKYGHVVRIAPDELAFSDPRAWKDIMGHLKSGEPEFEKPDLFSIIGDLPTTVINAPREEHGRLRKQLAHGFSDRSLREQQPIIKRYIDMLVQRLHENSTAGSETVDMVKCKRKAYLPAHRYLLMADTMNSQGTITRPLTLSVIFHSGNLSGAWNRGKITLGFR